MHCQKGQYETLGKNLDSTTYAQVEEALGDFVVVVVVELDEAH